MIFTARWKTNRLSISIAHKGQALRLPF